MWKLRTIELDIGYGWTARSRVERRKDHMEVRLGRADGNNLLGKVFEKMMVGREIRRRRKKDLEASVDLDMTNEHSLILRQRPLTAVTTRKSPLKDITAAK